MMAHMSSGGVRLVREVASVGATLLALLFLIVAIAKPQMLKDDVADNVRYQRQFRAIADHAMSHLRVTGQLPDDQQLQGWAESRGFETMAFSLTTSPVGCDGNFKAVAGDQLTLSFWRGEWSECYSAPSGKTTLLLSRREYAEAGMALELATLILLSALLSAAAWWMWPNRRSKLAKAN